MKKAALPPKAGAPTALEEASREALAALGGSMVSACVMYPLDLLKTRMQAGKPGEHTLLRAGRAVVREDGMSGLYRGLRTDLLKCGVLNFVYFFAYVHLKRALAAREAKREAGAHGEAGATEAPVTPPPRRGGSGGDGAQEAPKVAGPSPMLRLVAGIAAGVVSQLVTNPINVTLTYIQTTDQKTRGFLPTLARIVRAEGPGALYRGLAVGCVLTLNPAIQYYVYDRLLEWAKARSKVKSGGQHDEAKATQGAMSTPNGSLAPLAAPASRALGVGPVFAISSTAKLVATLLTYPLILSKTRMQAEGGGAQRSMVGVLAKVFADEGLGGLYTGFNVQATKSILSAALMMVIKEAIDDVAKDLYESMRRGGVHGK